MEQKLLEQLNQWHEEEEYEKIAEEIRKIPEKDWDYDLICHLARACNNLGEYDTAAGLLLQAQAEGEKDPLWHYRLGYAYYYLDREKEAKEELEKACRLDPSDRDAWYLLACCCEILEEESELSVPEGILAEARRDIAVANCSPVVYSEEEMDSVEEHIKKCFGDFGQVFHEIYSPDIHVDICIVEPSEERNYYTLVTMGMGARPMNVPEELKDAGVDRAELFLSLPPDWQLTSQEEIWYWPMRLLKVLARMPGEENSWLGWGHTVDLGQPLADNTAFTGALLASPADFPAETAVCRLPGGEEVNFYQVIPLYRQELDYKLSHNAESLLERLGEKIQPPLDIARENSCDFRSGKRFAIPGEKIRQILKDWDGPEGCMATDRIVVDGCPVGYMYREEPEKDYPDSGWRFLAGDETQEYMDDPANSGIYSLNTLCNYDPDILPFLRSPVQTAYYRDEDGVLQPEETSFLA